MTEWKRTTLYLQGWIAAKFQTDPTLHRKLSPIVNNFLASYLRGSDLASLEREAADLRMKAAETQAFLMQVEKQIAEQRNSHIEVVNKSGRLDDTIRRIADDYKQLGRSSMYDPQNMEWLKPRLDMLRGLGFNSTPEILLNFCKEYNRNPLLVWSDWLKNGGVK